jgi:pilus assembly protein Flp/PilA
MRIADADGSLRGLCPFSGARVRVSSRSRLMKALVTKFIKDEDGATAIEYGLIAALIAVAIITAVRAVGTELSNTFSTIESNLAGA